MSQASKIEWTDAVWNPVRGCSRVSEGCRHCYAESMAARFSGPGQPYEGLAVMKSDGPHWTGKVQLVEEALDWPRRWRGSKKAREEGRPSRIFVNSMSDLFHEGLTDEDIARVFKVMLASPQHIFQVLTKRPERMRSLLHREAHGRGWRFGWSRPAEHIHVGVSVEDQPTADERVPLVLQTPAAVRWISYEPALGSLDLTQMILGDEKFGGDLLSNSLKRIWSEREQLRPRLDWVVVGGESGPGARPMHPDWARSLRDQCQAAGVPFFFKQWGAWTPEDHLTEEELEKRKSPVEMHHWPGPGATLPSYRVGKKRAGRLLDGREWDEFPGGLL